MAEELDDIPAPTGRFRLPKLLVEPEDEPAETEAENVAEPPAPPAEAEWTPPPDAGSLGLVLDEIRDMRSELEHMTRLFNQINERESGHEKVFDALHEELRSYKNDFIYEHLKPVVRPLLFLFDSLEQYDTEVAELEVPPERERRGTILTAGQVRQNIAYFREQLVEALRICEVEQMDEPHGVVEPKLHKVMGAVPVAAGQENVIQRVLRHGWYLNGQLLRPAEVIVGKAPESRAPESSVPEGKASASKQSEPA